MSRYKVLIVEDDAAIRRGLSDILKFAGHDTVEASDGRQGLDFALTAGVDLVLLDVLMPKMDGFAVLKEIRKANATLPVILLTAKGEERDKVKGLSDGADDYVVKPFSTTELLARVTAVLRRSPQRASTVTRINIAGRTIDLERREVCFDDGSRADLTMKETETLAYLVRNSGRAISREELLQNVWGLDPRGVQTRTVDMTIARLRELLRDDSAQPHVIVTVRAKGYMLAQIDGTQLDSGASESKHAKEVR